MPIRKVFPEDYRYYDTTREYGYEREFPMRKGMLNSQDIKQTSKQDINKINMFLNTDRLNVLSLHDIKEDFEQIEEIYDKSDRHMKKTILRKVMINGQEAYKLSRLSSNKDKLREIGRFYSLKWAELFKRFN